jgi:peptide-methionine (S)-S-oxide reductase
MQRNMLQHLSGLLALVSLIVLTARGEVMHEVQQPDKDSVQKATFAGGCFWCVEAVFQRVNGVKSVRSGYTGGHVENPTYKQVCSGKTGHAEAVEIEFDPVVVSYAELLDLFWHAHDPSQLNRQGADVGTQYRSAIFYHSPEQKEMAEKSKQLLAESGVQVVTQIAPAQKFYEAEQHHQDYFNNNPTAPYCMFVIRPKLKKLDDLLNQPTPKR